VIVVGTVALETTAMRAIPGAPSEWGTEEMRVISLVVEATWRGAPVTTIELVENSTRRHIPIGGKGLYFLSEKTDPLWNETCFRVEGSEVPMLSMTLSGAKAALETTP
jgi:hypothetical protein